MCARDIWFAERSGKDTFLVIDKLGTDKMPFFFSLKGRTDAVLGKSLLRPHFTDRLCKNWGTPSPAHLPARMKTARSEHHLLLRCPAMALGSENWLTECLNGPRATSSPVAGRGGKAFLHRLAAAGAAIRYGRCARMK
ncbi:hypothetical protein ACNKHO_13695 [Shigella flexneri]